MTRRILGLCGLALVVALAASLSADEAASQPASIRVDDLLEFTVNELVAPRPSTFSQRVQSDGRIWVPQIGAMEVQGKTPEAVATAIDEAYRKAKLIRAANTSVRVIETAAKATIRAGKIKPGDGLFIVIYDMERPGARSTYDPTVSEAGYISLPLIGQVLVTDHNDHECAKLIVHAYSDANLIRNATLTVERVKAPEPR